MAAWHDAESLAEEWTDAPEGDALEELLTVAREAVEAYGGERDDPEVIPSGWRVAQRLQARAVWLLSEVDSGGDLGEGAFVITPRPLDWAVRQLVRPKRGVPVVA